MQGGSKFSQPLMSPGLIDEYWINFHTVVLRGGKPLFRDIKARIPLKLSNSTTFNSGSRWLLLRTDPVECSMLR